MGSSSGGRGLILIFHTFFKKVMPNKKYRGGDIFEDIKFAGFGD